MTIEQSPQEWAAEQVRLGNDFLEDRSEKRGESIEQAIFHFQQALTVYTKDAFPAEWAQTTNNLAIAYGQRIKGERGENLEQAIALYQQALTVQTIDAFPAKWATITYNLGNAYSYRIKGERKENLEQAIALYKEALTVRTIDAFPADWATTTNNLANAYKNRIKGERGENLEQAIALYKEALTVHTIDAFPTEWALTTDNLAATYSDRTKGERGENVEQSIAYYQEILNLRTKYTFPLKWAATTNDLANAYSYRIKGERGENLEQAIVFYQQVLTVYTPDTFPIEWAATTDNLAAAYYSRIKGKRGENLEQAIALYKKALTVSTRDAFPTEWATTTNNLAAAYYSRIKGERGENLEQAIALYKKALTVSTRDAFPTEWAGITNNLALAYSDRIKGERGENLEQAIALYKKALTVSTRDAFPTEWANTTYNLAGAYWLRRIGNSAQDIKPALDCFRQSRSVLTPQSFPYDCRWQAYQFGQLFYKARRIGEARYAFGLAHEAVEVLRTEVLHWRSKQALATENVELYEKLVFCCLYERDIEAAFGYAMAGKGRAFVDLLATTGLDRQDVEQREPQLAQALQEYDKLRKEIDAQWAALMGVQAGRGASGEAEEESRSKRTQWRARLDDLHHEADEQWQQISHQYPILMATRSEPALSPEQARQLAASLGATLVEYFRHTGGWSAFVVTADEIKHILLPLIDKKRWESRRFVEIVHDLPSGQFNLMTEEKELKAEADKWLTSIHRPTFRAPLSLEFLSRIHEQFIAPVEASGLLKEGQPLVLAPFGWLNNCPLWAARSRETGRYMGECYQLSYVPSLTALYVTMVQTQLIAKGVDATPVQLVAEGVDATPVASKPSAFFAAAYAGEPKSPYHLPHVHDETQTIAALFTNPTVLYENDATPQAVISSVHDKEIVHLGCHGRFDARYPQESGLMLAEGWLTVRQIIRNWPWRTEDAPSTSSGSASRRLITVAACFGARSDVKTGEDYMGLTQALLAAGAQTVVAGLWAVDDEATRFLFEAFYSQLKAGHSPAQALQHAIAFVRKRWQHPYYWGAFQVCGLAYHATTTEAPTLSADLIARAQKAQESTTRGIDMNKSALLSDVEDRLVLLATYTKAAVKALSYDEWKEVQRGLEELLDQADRVDNEADLLTLAHNILLLIERITSWQTLVFPEKYNIEQEQQSRSALFADIQFAAQMDNDTQEQLTNLNNHLRTFSKNFDTMLPPPRPLIQQPPPAPQLTRWEKIKDLLGWY